MAARAVRLGGPDCILFIGVYRRSSAANKGLEKLRHNATHKLAADKRR
jgi:hypothetical protein